MMNRVEKVSSLAWLMLSIAIILGSSTYSLGALINPGPAFLPMLCGIIMAGLSLAIFIQAILKDKGKAKEKEEGNFFTSRWQKVIGALISLCIYALLLEALGFFIVTFVFILFMLKVVEPRKWRTVLAEAGLGTIGSYLIFELWLKMQLPKGFWAQLFK